MSQSTAWEGIEFVPDLEDPENRETIWVIKYPVQIAGTVIGVAGTAVPTKKIMIHLSQQ